MFWAYLSELVVVSYGTGGHVSDYTRYMLGKNVSVDAQYYRYL